MSIPESSSEFRVPSSEFKEQAKPRSPINWKLKTGNSRRRKSLGFSLVEQIVFIVVVGVAVAGVLLALNVVTRGSVDPVVQKQALAIAEAVLEEVQLQPFTYCDPDDANAATALNAAGCATTAEALGPEPGESRLSATAPFDNVNDYHGFSMSGGITDIAGDSISGLGSYSVSVSVAGQALGGIASSDALLITVTVTHPAITPGLVLHGYRVRYAPNALP